MVVAVVRVAAVLVVVLERLVAVRMCVLADERRIVRVRVVLVVVPMHVVVIDRLVHVAVTMTLGEVQVDADGE